MSVIKLTNDVKISGESLQDCMDMTNVIATVTISMLPYTVPCDGYFIESVSTSNTSAADPKLMLDGKQIDTWGTTGWSQFKYWRVHKGSVISAGGNTSVLKLASETRLVGLK